MLTIMIMLYNFYNSPAGDDTQVTPSTRDDSKRIRLVFIIFSCVDKVKTELVFLQCVLSLQHLNPHEDSCQYTADIHEQLTMVSNTLWHVGARYSYTKLQFNHSSE